VTGGKRARLIRLVVETDATFERQLVRGEEVWVGRCIHCQRRLVAGLDGSASPGVTIEHVVPRNHGGTDEALNLALACGGCNAEKGLRYDWRRRDDPRRVELEQALRERRLARWRDPPQGPSNPHTGSDLEQGREPERKRARGRSQ
jgi:5-methylcytosine-specific restriction endonuclease McrA